MNPYKTFEKLGGVRSLDATLIKKDGTRLALYVKPETNGAETFESEYAAAIGVRTWSANYADFIGPDDSTLWPESGDSLIVKVDDGTLKSYSITRSTSTARFWDWTFTRPGYRVKFYTKYEGADVDPTALQYSSNGGQGD